MAGQGKIIINGDEHTLGNPGYLYAPDVARFVQNVANWLTGGRPGRLHAYSTSSGLTGNRLAETMKSVGHTWTVGTEIPFNLESLRRFDAVFLAGNPADNQVLIDYVRSGGSVYLAGGTGWGGAAGEARRWKAFLNAFGFKLEERDDGVARRLDIAIDHPVFEGVGLLLHYHGNAIVDIDPSAPENAILWSHNGMGLLGIFDLALARPNVVISDLLYDGRVARSEADEYVELTNQGTAHTDISGWTISAGRSGQDFFFPAGTVLGSGQTIRVYTNQEHPETGGFSFKSRRAIWNNKGDVAHLFNAAGTEVSTLAYGSKKVRTIPDVLREQGVPGAAVDTSARALQEELGGKVDFLTALEKALKSLIEDPADGRHYTAATAVKENWDNVPANADAATIQGLIRNHINTQQIILLSEDNLGDASESPKNTWVFRLKQGMGDLHYIYVDRAGKKETYQEIA